MITAAETCLDYLDRKVGERYRNCTIDGFELVHPSVEHAKALCRNYVTSFRSHFADGRGLVFIGPKGTGKDHLMIAVMRAIIRGYDIQQPGRVRYEDGMKFYRRCRDTFKCDVPEETIIEPLYFPHLLGLSDPIPPSGELSEYEQKVLFALVDQRYRHCRPTAATINVRERDELDRRMGSQIADRLCDRAIVVKCFWKSHRNVQ